MAGEFQLIDRIRARVARRGDVVLGIGDDAALLQPPPGMQLAVATDTLNIEIGAKDDKIKILRVADIFQAMVQDRPYRAGLPAAAVLDFVREMARQGRVDGQVVAAAAADLAGAMAAARAA